MNERIDPDSIEPARVASAQGRISLERYHADMAALAEHEAINRYRLDRERLAMTRPFRNGCPVEPF